jgi:DNA-binding transcriptional LysR family regulator
MRDLATQRAARSEKTSFVVGFLSGYEVALLPELLGVLRDDLCDAELTLVSSPSPELTRDLISGKVDLAFIRPYDPPPELALKLLEKEPLVVIMPRDHPMADRPTIRLEDISSEALISIISISRPDAPALPRSIDEFVARSGVTLAAGLEARRPGGPEADQLQLLRWCCPRRASAFWQVSPSVFYCRRSSAFTYVATAEGWLYLVVVIDLFSRQVVGWSIQPHMKADMVTDALRMAWFRRRPEAGVVLHSDRGSQGGFNRSSQHL